MKSIIILCLVAVATANLSTDSGKVCVTLRVYRLIIYIQNMTNVKNNNHNKKKIHRKVVINACCILQSLETPCPPENLFGENEAQDCCSNPDSCVEGKFLDQLAIH